MIIRKKTTITLMFWLIFSITSFGGVTANAGDRRISGSSTVLPMIQAAARVFEQETGIDFHVVGGGSGKGIRDTIAGESNIGMVSRALTAKEEGELTAFTLGYDGVAVVIHANNPVTQISRQNIKAIFTGDAIDWSLFGGPVQKSIVLISKEKGRSTREIFDNAFSINSLAESATLVGANAEVLALVGIEPDAIGYASIGAIERAQNVGLKVKALPVDGIAATSENVKLRKFPVLRQLNLVVKKNHVEDKAVTQFIRFMLSPRARDIILNKNYIPVE